MMSEEHLESGQASAKQAPPEPKFEDSSADSQISNVGLIAKQVAEILKPDFERMAQSTKDKRIAKLEKAVGGLAELEAMGVEIPDHVKLEMRLREIENRGSVPETNSQGSGNVQATEWARIVDEVGLDVKSPEYIEFLSKKYRNLDHFEAEAYKLKTRMDNKPKKSLETSPSLTGKAVEREGMDDKVEELARLQSNPSKANKARREELRKELQGAT